MGSWFQNGVVNIPVSGGAITIDTTKNKVILTDSYGKTVDINFSDLSKSSFTLDTGALKVTLSADGTGNYNFSSGIFSGSIGFDASGAVTSLATEVGLAKGGAKLVISTSVEMINNNWYGEYFAGAKISGTNAVSSAINDFLNRYNQSLLQKADCVGDFSLFGAKLEGAGGHFWHDAVIKANTITPAP